MTMSEANILIMNDTRGTQIDGHIRLVFDTEPNDTNEYTLVTFYSDRETGVEFARRERRYQLRRNAELIYREELFRMQKQVF